MTPSGTNRFSVAIGTWLLVQGVWGFFSPTVFGFLTTNHLHAAIHLVLGLTGLWTAFNDRAGSYLWCLGPLLLAVGLAYFLPVGDRVSDVLNMNTAVAIFNLVVGTGGLLCAVRYDR